MESLPDRPLPPRPVGRVLVEWLQWFGAMRLFVTVVSVLAVGAGGYWLLRTPAPPVEDTLPYAVPSAATLASSTAQPTATDHGDGPAVDSTDEPNATIIVYVTGAVMQSGVYDLPHGSRVQQAVAAAGGMTADADIDAVNLAGFLSDGDRIYVPRVGIPVPAVVIPAAGPGAADQGDAGSGPSAPIDLNRASIAELDALPGIGPSTAAAIVTHRELHGPFSTVESLLDVRGIGPGKLDALRDLITV